MSAPAPTAGAVHLHHRRAAERQQRHRPGHRALPSVRTRQTREAGRLQSGAEGLIWRLRTLIGSKTCRHRAMMAARLAEHTVPRPIPPSTGINFIIDVRELRKCLRRVTRTGPHKDLPKILETVAQATGYPGAIPGRTSDGG